MGICEYKKVREIGRGAYSKVYSTDREDLALKVISCPEPGYVCSSTLWDIVIPTTMNHRNVCKIEKVIYGDDEVRIAMKKYTPIRKLDLTIMFKILHALNYLHSNNVIHRDIKKDNIMMDGGEPVIIDFSLSRVGLHDEMSSEVYTEGCRHKSVLTGKYGYECDIYALGMTFTSILLGYTQGQLFSSRRHSLSLQLDNHGDMGRITKSMIDPDNIPSLSYLLSLDVFKDMDEPHHLPPTYRSKRTLTTSEEAKLGMSLYIYDVVDTKTRNMAYHIYSQHLCLSNHKRDLVDLCRAVTDDTHSYSISVSILSEVAHELSLLPNNDVPRV